jgi:hypothetical protein
MQVGKLLADLQTLQKQHDPAAFPYQSLFETEGLLLYPLSKYHKGVLNNVFKSVGFYDTKKIIPRDRRFVFVKLIRPTGTFLN